MDKFYEKLLDIIIELLIGTYIGVILAFAITSKSDQASISLGMFVELFSISLLLIVGVYIFLYKKFEESSKKEK